MNDNSKNSPTTRPVSGKKASGSDKAEQPSKKGGDARKAQEWGGGSKASKGAITKGDRQNPNSSARS